MDYASLVGLVSGVILLTWGLMSSTDNVWIYWNVPSLILTIGGGIAATIISLPTAILKNCGRVARQMFKEDKRSPAVLISNLVRYAEIARKDGILALEGVTTEVDDQFLVKGIQLAVDGTDPDLIQETLRTELENISERHTQAKKLWDLLGKYAPAYGLIGTIVGLVAMLSALDDPSAIGKGMAVALLTTLYGAMAAYLIFMPFSDKLTLKDKNEALMKEIVIRGVMSIQSGDNPRIVAQKLRIFLPPDARPDEKAEKAAA